MDEGRLQKDSLRKSQRLNHTHCALMKRNFEQAPAQRLKTMDRKREDTVLGIRREWDRVSLEMIFKKSSPGVYPRQEEGGKP